jgi:triacylglycerol lipase
LKNASFSKFETVVLLHGILTPRWIMWPIARRLRKEGYRTALWAFPGSRSVVETHAAALRSYVDTLPGEGPIHFVGFSLGAIVARYLLAHVPMPRAGRFVMIGPPNHGSALAEYLFKYRWFRWSFGTTSVRQLFPGATAFFEACGIPPVEFGIIAGGTGDARGFASAWNEDNDGTVTVESTRLPGARDFIRLRCLHMLLVFARVTQDQVVYFLRHGSFQRSPEKQG